MSEDPRLLKLIAEIYDAAADTSRWQAVLAQTCSFVSANAAEVEIRDLRVHSLSFSRSHNVEYIDAYRQYYAERNIVLIRGAAKLLPGHVVTQDILCPNEEYVGSEIYNDFFLPLGVHHMAGGAILRDPNAVGILTVTRPKQRRPFAGRERRRLELLMPHLQRSIDLARRLGALEAQKLTSTEAFDLVPFGIVLLNLAGRPIFVNRYANSIFASHDGLDICKDGIRVRGEKGPVLAKLVVDAAATASGKGTHNGGEMRIRRPSGKRDYSLVVTPLRNTDVVLNPLCVPSAAVFVTDPEDKAMPPAETLSRLYGLTPAEARISLKLLQGGSLVEAADKLGISRNTAHSQLKAVYEKTGTRRQSELVRLLLSPALRLLVRNPAQNDGSSQ